MPIEFHWILPGLLAGSGRPGLLSQFEADMANLRRLGFRLVLTLTEDPLDPPVSQFGMRGLHFPIQDMGIPTPHAAAKVCREVTDAMDAGEPVLVHCKAGLGRTGMILACCLISLGRHRGEAFRAVRAACPHYIQVGLQEAFLAHYAQHLAESAGREAAGAAEDRDPRALLDSPLSLSLPGTVSRS